MAISFGTAKIHDIETALDWFLHNMSMEQRLEFAAEYPKIYNRICGQKVTKVYLADREIGE
jgi:hypothetical protein